MSERLAAPDFQRPGEVSYRPLPSPFAASATVLEALRTGVAPDGQALFRYSPPPGAGPLPPRRLLPCLAGGAPGAPALAIQTGELRPHAPRAAQLGRLTPLSYGLRGALQRLSRTTLSVVGMAVSTGLVVLFLLVSLELRGALEATLLGTHIALQIRPYHYAMAGVCFAVSALALTDVMLLNVLERRREIGTLKAVGWRTDAVAGLFVREGADRVVRLRDGRLAG